MGISDVSKGNGKAALITDQDIGIGKALSNVFPNTHHRLCMWHILDKVPDKLGLQEHNKQFMKSFKDNIWKEINPEEFEISWKDLLKKNDLNNDWLNSLWMIRERWVPAYHRTHFQAGASSTRRSEGMNAHMKMHISRLNTLFEFVVHYDRILTRQRERDSGRSWNIGEKNLRTMEKQMSQVYMTYAFYKFREEIKESLMQNVCMIAEESSERRYQVSKCGDQNHKKVSKIFWCKELYKMCLFNV